MIVEAIDKRTGRTVRAENVYSGQRLECPYCSVDVHPVLGGETPFFRCYEGGKHTNYICEQLDRTNRVYDPQLTDIEQLFDNLFHPVREKEEPSWESDEDEGLIEPEMEDESLYGDESEYSWSFHPACQCWYHSRWFCRSILPGSQDGFALA